MYMRHKIEADYWTLDAMEKYGGSFVQALAQLARRADAYNYETLLVAFPKYFKSYENLGQAMKAKDDKLDGDAITAHKVKLVDGNISVISKDGNSLVLCVAKNIMFSTIEEFADAVSPGVGPWLSNRERIAKCSCDIKRDFHIELSR
jgi:hypothetical protein